MDQHEGCIRFIYVYHRFIVTCSTWASSNCHPFKLFNDYGSVPHSTLFKSLIIHLKSISTCCRALTPAAVTVLVQVCCLLSRNAVGNWLDLLVSSFMSRVSSKGRLRPTTWTRNRGAACCQIKPRRLLLLPPPLCFSLEVVWFKESSPTLCSSLKISPGVETDVAGNMGRQQD